MRLHLAVNSDSSWTVRHISLMDIHTETLFFFLCFSSFLPFIPPPPLCLWLWPSASVAKVWFMMSCITAQQAAGVYTKQPSALTIPLFIPRSRQNTVRSSPFEGVVGGPWQGGPFHNLGLVHGAVGWCAVSVWWLLLSKKCLSSLLWANISMDRHIARNLSSELGVWGSLLGRFVE